MDKKINTLYKDYKNGGLDRRDFLKKLVVFTGGTAAAMAILPSLQNNYLKASEPRNRGPEIQTDFITYPGATGDIRALLARPKVETKLPAVVVIHENKGLQPHIQDRLL